MKSIRRIAAHEVLSDGKTFEMHVAELHDGVVAKLFPLTEEIAFTEWLGGKIEIKLDSNGNKKAYKDNRIIE